MSSKSNCSKLLASYQAKSSKTGSSRSQRDSKMDDVQQSRPKCVLMQTRKLCWTKHWFKGHPLAHKSNCWSPICNHNLQLNNTRPQKTKGNVWMSDFSMHLRSIYLIIKASKSAVFKCGYVCLFFGAQCMQFSHVYSKGMHFLKHKDRNLFWIKEEQIKSFSKEEKVHTVWHWVKTMEDMEDAWDLVAAVVVGEATGDATMVPLKDWCNLNESQQSLLLSFVHWWQHAARKTLQIMSAQIWAWKTCEEIPSKNITLVHPFLKNYIGACCQTVETRGNRRRDWVGLGRQNNNLPQQDVRNCMQHQNKLEDNMHKSVRLVLWQCTATDT